MEEEGKTEEEAERMITREVEECVKIFSVVRHNQAVCGLPTEDASAGRLDLLTLVSRGISS